jgi:hypothetical protein
VHIASEDFDPSDFLPYDEGAFRKLARNGLSLDLGRGTAAVGSLLDTWSRIEFDHEARTLRAFVYRPVGPCVNTGGEYTCRAEERGVEVTVSVSSSS